jgi:hypothetical protein
MLNLEDERIHILYQRHILDSSRGMRAYVFLRTLLKKSKYQLSDKMPTPSDIEKETPIGSFGTNLKYYYLQVQVMGVSFDDNTKSRFYLLSLPQKFIEVDRFVDNLDNVPDADPLPEELTLAELVLRIKYIYSFHHSSTAVINHYVGPTNDRDSSNPRHNQQSSSSDSRPPRPSFSDGRPVRDFRTCSDTQCICGRWEHAVENCQQMAMHLFVANYFQKDANMTSAAQISEHWLLTK